jgi:hypothetical protein
MAARARQIDMTAEPDCERLAPARDSAIAHAIKVNALAQLAREIGIAEALAVLATMDDRTPRERAAEVRRSRRSALLSEYERLVKLGKGRNAAKMAARKFANGDLVEEQNLARNIRRWR